MPARTLSRMARVRLLAIFILLTLPRVSGADVYSFTDPGGTVHFSNVPNDARYAVLLVAAAESPLAGEALPPAAVVAAARLYRGLIDSAAEQYKLDPELLHAVIAVESGYNAKAVSKAGARGLMQLMPATARRFGVGNSFDPAQNIRGGARYLAHLRQRYGNDMKLVLAAYNAGEAAVDRHKSVPPFKETRRYVPRVLAIYSQLVALGARFD